MQYGGKKNALGAMVSMIALLLCALASWLSSTRAMVEAMSGNEDTLAICAVVLAIVSFVLIIVFVFFGAKMLMAIDGKGMAFYVIVSIGIIFIGIILLLTIPSLLKAISLI